MNKFIQSFNHPVYDREGIARLIPGLDIYLNDIYEVWVYR